MSEQIWGRDGVDGHPCIRVEAYERAVDDLRIATARAEAAEAKIARIVKVHDYYFDTDREPFDDASPEPEDVWRYDRDLRAALADEGDTHE